MYKICVYLPESDLEQVKSAMFNAGAGHIGEYDQCCWQVKGDGQFRPLAGSTPTLGVINNVETVTEYKLETVCADDLLQQVLQALTQAHSYEEPAYQYWRVNEKTKEM